MLAQCSIICNLFEVFGKKLGEKKDVKKDDQSLLSEIHRRCSSMYRYTGGVGKDLERFSEESTLEVNKQKTKMLVFE